MDTKLLMIAYLLSTLVILLTVLLVVRQPARPYFLSMLASAKNESMVIAEWVEHYLWQGVEHFYIIDNGSDDGTCNVLARYIANGVVTCLDRPKRYAQTEHYNEVFRDFAQEASQWVIVADVDEYIYNRTPGSTIADYLRGLDPESVSAVSLRWKMFGSSGHVEQPPSVRMGFTRRKSELDPNTKCIVNADLTTQLRIHTSVHLPGPRIVENPMELALNHYAIMSKEYFARVKMTRGDVDTALSNNVRDWDYFQRYDRGADVLDDELARLLVQAEEG